MGRLYFQGHHKPHGRCAGSAAAAAAADRCVCWVDSAACADVLLVFWATVVNYLP